MIHKSEWEEVAGLAKNIREDLFQLKKLSGELGMKNPEIKPLIKSINQLDQYRSKAENLMFKKGETDINIFYGDNE